MFCVHHPAAILLLLILSYIAQNFPAACGAFPNEQGATFIGEMSAYFIEQPVSLSYGIAC
jgi:hypothetical protein